MQAVHAQQQLQQGMHESSGVSSDMEKLRAAYAHMQQEAQQLQQDNEDLLREHDAAREEVIRDNTMLVTMMTSCLL